MTGRIEQGRVIAALVAVLTFTIVVAFALPAPVQAQSGHPLLGGPKGIVKSRLISQKSAPSTTEDALQHPVNTLSCKAPQ